MAQKNKVKELVGRGLNSYHTKALQQMDRIEKKNKEQNHKISILSNELDNDYLTKTEEGSVISLEHSKEGMVYLDELQGNTLVNYCTDGSKEMTLNGDIDVEGTNVTLTEGVDNGKVDVMCEGNTLVNLVSDINSSNFVTTSNNEITYKMNNTAYPACIFKVNGLVNGKTYTSILDVKKNSRFIHMGGTKEGEIRQYATYNTTGRFVNKFTIPSDDNNYNLLSMWTQGDNSDNDLIISYPIILEGDWTNKEIPTSYFEGMKSVGQDDVNGHKIEILSQNKNLCTVNSYSGVRHNKIETNIPCKKNTIYTLTFKDESDLNQSGSRGITLITHKTKTDKNDHGSIYTYAMGEGGKEYTFRESGFTFNTSDCCYISLTSNNMASVPNLIIKEIQIEEGSQTSYSPHTFNKKEISLNEPLRGLPSGSKDKIIKISGKYFIERNIRQKLLTGADSEKWLIHSDSDENVIEFRCNAGSPSIVSNSGSAISDKFIGKSGGNIDRIAWAGDTVYITISRNKLTTVDVAGLRQWLSNNNVLVQNQLATPIYEPLEVEPTLLTYNDVTHISNNSIVPCTMKIKNTGYNAIIKPSTLYTVALDTNKSGTIGMNLGGAKVTTTNNIATITTPATLTDDSLRLYGKGIKGSKVRLLEGDKTNWIPSHFEGMKSSFEDKAQEDGSYKMEILSNNKNLFNGTWVYDERNNKINSGDLIKVKPNTTYTISDNLNYRYQIYEYVDKNKHFNSMYPYAGSYTFTTSKRTHYLMFSTYAPSTDVNVKFLLEEGRNVNSYEPNKSNKIQFSSIEPLRSTTDISDRFIFKDGKIMIERNCIERDLTYFKFTTTEIKGLNLRGGITISDAYRQPQGGSNTTMKCDKLASSSKEGIIPCINIYHHTNSNELRVSIPQRLLKTMDINGINDYFANNPHKVIYRLAEPYYEEIPFELQKIILEGYENGTLFFDTNIPPTSTVTYAGETPIVKATKLNKTKVLNNTEDINDNIIPYLMDMDYRVVMLQLATEEIEGGVSMARLFGGTYEMIKRDILSKRLTREEYGYRLADYFNAGKLTEEQVRELEELR